MRELAILLSLTEEPTMADPENDDLEPEAEEELLEEDPEYEDPPPEPKPEPAVASEPQYNEDLPHEALMLYKAAAIFCERMERGQKHLAMKESLPNLQIAVKKSRSAFLNE